MRTLNDSTLENAILGKIVMTLLDDGFRVILSDQDGGGLYLYANPDNGDQEPEGGYKYWIRLTPGNGVDFITDYTINLEKIMKPVEDFIASQDA